MNCLKPLGLTIHVTSYTINISEEAYQAILSAARHRFGRYQDVAKWIKIIFDTGALIRMLANLLTFVRELITLTIPVTIRMGKGTSCYSN